MSAKAPITAVISVKNEEVAIAECIRSLAFCDQVIVVDSNSTDATCDIAEAEGAEVVNFSWNGQYPKKKEWILSMPQARHDHLLYMDGDERISPQLADELTQLMASGRDVAAAEVRLTYHFAGVELKHGRTVTKRILLDRKRCTYPHVDDLAVSSMGELEGHYQAITDGPVVLLDNPLDHDDPDALFDYFSRHNKYSDWEAFLRLHPQVQEQVRGARSWQGQLFDRAPFKPLAFFLYGYVVKQGFRDGRAGFDYAAALTFYYWQIGAKVREAKRRGGHLSSTTP